MKKIRIVHYGIGHDHSPQYLDAIKEYPDVFEILGVCEPNEKMREECGHFDAYKGLKWLTEEEMFKLDGVDAVMVEAHDLDLVKYAQKCADRGWHIHMDKAAGVDIEAFKKLLRTVKEKNLVFQMGYMFRYNAIIKYALEEKRLGHLGEIYHMDAFMNTRHPRDKREWMSHLPGGDMLYLGCHMVDMILLFQGIPNRIIPLNKNTGLDGLDYPDECAAVFEYDKGVSFVRASAVEVNGYGRRQVVICGSDKTIEIRRLEAPTIARVTDIKNAATYAEKSEKMRVEQNSILERYYEMMLDFAAFVRGEKENPYTLEYEYTLQKLVLAACGMDIDYKKCDLFD